MLTGRFEKNARFKGIEYYNYLEKFGVDLSLERVTSLLGVLGNPHEKYPVLLVGGTNGKGSVSSMLCSILRYAGYKCGCYLSPHVFSIEERISVNGVRISKEELDGGFVEISKMCISEKIDITQFEAITALAYLFFQEKAVDVAVMEVGMGGRFDATNAADPILSVITNVSKDHTEHLGSEIEEIAFEKLGICRNSAPVVIGQSPGMEGYEYLVEKSKELSSIQFINGMDFRFTKRSSDGFDITLDVEMIENVNTRDVGPFSMRDLHVPGCSYQASNAALAVVAARILGKMHDFGISEREIRNGIEAFSITARCQRIMERPLIILDCAHNTAGVSALCHDMRSLLVARRMGDECRGNLVHRKINWVCSFMRDKDISSMLEQISQTATCVFLAELPLPRSAGVHELALAASDVFEPLDTDKKKDETGKRTIRSYNIFSDHRTAVIAALSSTTENDILVIAGSIYSLRFFADVLSEFFPEIEL